MLLIEHCIWRHTECLSFRILQLLAHYTPRQLSVSSILRVLNLVVLCVKSVGLTQVTILFDFFEYDLLPFLALGRCNGRSDSPLLELQAQVFQLSTFLQC